jgi:hypothetical protein
VERLLEAVTTDGHQFRAQRKANIDAARCDLVCNILCSLETGGTESVYCGGGGCVWEASCKGSGTEFVCGFAIGDLQIGMLNAEVSGSWEQLKRTYIATANILNEFRVEF